MFTKSVFFSIIIILVHILFPHLSFAQLNDSTNCKVEIVKDSYKGRVKYRPNYNLEKWFYFENEFADSISFYINDSLLFHGFVKTEFSSGSSRIITKFKYSNSDNINCKIISEGRNGKLCKKTDFRLSKKLLRKYGVFLIYRTTNKWIIHYSNYLPYYE